MMQGFTAKDALRDRRAAIALLQDEAAARGIAVGFTDPADASSTIRVQRRDALFLLRPDHAIYAKDIVDQFDYYFSSTVPQQHDGLRVADYSRPGWHELPSGGRMYYTSFAEDVGATADYLAYLRPAPGETVLDVGAYCGYSVLAFSRAVGPAGRVYAFEPDPDNFAALERNVGEAKACNVHLRNAALSDRSGSLPFSSEGNMGSAIVREAGSRGRAIEVRSERLAALLQAGEVPRFDVAKIDIEGAEYALLEDCVDVVRETKARWAVEMHVDPVTGRDIDVDRIRSIFDEAGYLSYLQCASDCAAAPTLFAYPDGRFPATAQDRGRRRPGSTSLESPPSHRGRHATAPRSRATIGSRLRHLLLGS